MNIIKFKKKVSQASLILFLFLFIQCNKENKDCKHSSETVCNTKDPKFDIGKEDDLSLKFNSKKQLYQTIHIGVLNNFGILAKPIIENDTVLNLKAKLIEIIGCEKLTLKESVFVRSCTDSTGATTHHLKFVVNKYDSSTNQKRNTKIDVKGNFTFKKGDALDVHVFSDLENIPTPNIPSKDCKINKPFDPERICKSIIVN